MPNNIYDKYGISESYIPKVYFNKIVLDTGHGSPVVDTTVLPYIDEAKPAQYTAGFKQVGDEPVPDTTSVSALQGFDKKTTGKKTKISVTSNIIFNVSSDAEFKKIIEDDDFGTSMSILCYAFYQKIGKGPHPTIFWNTTKDSDVPSTKVLWDSILETGETQTITGLDGEEIEVPISDPKKDAIVSKALKSSTNGIISSWPVSMMTILNSLTENAKTFDIFQKYKKTFPNGKIYYEIPYVFDFELEVENPENIFLLSFCKVEDFELDLTLNFGDFQINDPDTTLSFFDLEGSENNIGPLTFETVAKDGKIQDFGAIFTISNNQSTLIPLVNPAKVLEENLLREETFNDLKGTPWFGGVHKHVGRFMAGDSHIPDVTHPYLDVHIVPNDKIIDLRPLKEIQEAKIDLSPVKTTFGATSIKYSGNETNKLISDKLTIISDPLLTSTMDENINGFFAVDYMKFLRKHGLVPALLEHLAKGGELGYEAFDQQMAAAEALEGYSSYIWVNGIKQSQYELITVEELLSKFQAKGLAPPEVIWYEGRFTPPSEIPEGAKIKHLKKGAQSKKAEAIKEIQEAVKMFEKTGYGIKSHTAVALEKTLNIKITRIGPYESKIIYDSNFVKEDGIYPKFEHDPSGRWDDKPPVEKPLGYLNVVNLTKNSFDLNNLNLIEFYTFTDLDEEKKYDVEYRYKIECTFSDPLHTLLTQYLTLIDNAINGEGKQMGIKQLVSLLSVLPENSNILNESGSPYIEGSFLDLLPSTSLSDEGITGGLKTIKLLEYIENYDQQNNTESLEMFNTTLACWLPLFSSDALPILLNSQKTQTKIDKNQVFKVFKSAININNLSSKSNQTDLVYILNMLTSLRADLASTINGLSNVNATKSSNSAAKNALISTKSPMNSSGMLRRIKEEKVSKMTIKKTNHGFDYTSIFFSEPEVSSFARDLGLRQIPIGFYLTFIEKKILPKYLDPGVIGKDTGVFKQLGVNYSKSGDSEKFLPSVSKNAFSYLLLEPDGIKIPERLKIAKDFKSWNSILQVLLLFKKDKLARITEENIFGFSQQQTSEFFWGDDWGGKQFEAMKSVERNQTLALDSGLSIQDPIKTKDKTTMYNSDNKVLAEGVPMDITKGTSITDKKINYFLSYVNNYTEGQMNLPKITLSHLNLSAEQAFNCSIANLSLVLFSKDKVGELGSPNGVSSYDEFCKTLFDDNKQLFANNYAEYFFTFINGVKVEYLHSFEKFTLDGVTPSTLAQKDNLDISSGVWKRLDLKTLNSIPMEESTLCRLTHHKVPFFEEDDIAKELSFYPKFHKYFLLIKGQKKDNDIKGFGSTL